MIMFIEKKDIIFFKIGLKNIFKSYHIKYSDFSLKLKISITTEPIGFFILGKLHIGPVMVLGYFLHLSLGMVLSYFYTPLCAVEY